MVCSSTENHNQTQADRRALNDAQPTAPLPYALQCDRSCLTRVRRRNCTPSVQKSTAPRRFWCETLKITRTEKWIADLTIKVLKKSV